MAFGCGRGAVLGALVLLLACQPREPAKAVARGQSTTGGGGDGGSASVPEIALSASSSAIGPARTRGLFAVIRGQAPPAEHRALFAEWTKLIGGSPLVAKTYDRVAAEEIVTDVLPGVRIVVFTKTIDGGHRFEAPAHALVVEGRTTFLYGGLGSRNLDEDGYEQEMSGLHGCTADGHVAFSRLMETSGNWVHALRALEPRYCISLTRAVASRLAALASLPEADGRRSALEAAALLSRLHEGSAAPRVVEDPAALARFRRRIPDAPAPVRFTASPLRLEATVIAVDDASSATARRLVLTATSEGFALRSLYLADKVTPLE